MEALKEFLKIGYGYGDGSGDGYDDGSGYGSGSGSGYGSGSGNGEGYGSGNGYGDGYGYGYGSGNGEGYGSGDGYDDGSGYGSGSGNGYGSGYGYGYGGGISKINDLDVHRIDGIQTVITSLHNNIAKGFILNSDLTLEPCYVVKSGNCFAHGETLHEAQEALQEKIFEDMDEDERIDAFLNEFSLDKKYPATMFFDWHNKLTGSCRMGRETFCKNHGIDIKTDEFTVAEFISLTENDYGGEIITRLKERINHET